MRNISTFILGLIGASLLISGCMKGFSSSNQVARSPASHLKSLAGENSACYADRCLQTEPFSQIADPSDYKYQNPATFPTASLRSQYVAPIRFIDLMSISETLSLSPDFEVGDFMIYSHDRYGVFSTTVAHILQEMRTDLGAPIWITSGYRSPAHNAQVGGVAWSRHMYGDAVDFTTPTSPNYQLLQNLCLKYDASFTLIYTDHIHCDWRKYPLDPAFYGLPSGGIRPMEKSNMRHGTVTPAAQIVTSTLFPQDKTIRFWVIFKNEEIEGTPIYDWQITTASNVTLHYTTPTVSLPLNQAPFEINVTVGGSIHLKTIWR